ncbi:MFS transporter (Seo1) [Diplodia intermedia]|uniref:MFS transporter (Seo1) n=1 Tax=Diplodia intermedia TaxID=856260 RepID=A0ABR3T0L8_9PEZI
MYQLALAAIALLLAYLRALVSAQNDVSILGTTLPPTTTTTTTSKDVAAASTATTSTSGGGPATITITVNRVANLFVPENATAAVGDVVKFEFWPTNNSVARADYGYPCVPYALTAPDRADSAFWSGFRPVVANLAQVNITELPAYYITINRVTPLWFYNSAPDACAGHQMVGVINPASPTQLAVQKRAAAAATLALSPGEALPQGSSLSSSSSSAAATTASSRSSSVPTTPPDKRLPQLPEEQGKKEGPYELGG